MLERRLRIEVSKTVHGLRAAYDMYDSPTATTTM